MTTFYGRRYFDESDSLAHFFYTGNSGKSIKSSNDKKKQPLKTEKKTENTSESGGGERKKRDLNGTSISDERGTDGKQNNTSEYNHEYYEENPEKWEDNDKTESSKSKSKSTSSKSKSKSKTKTSDSNKKETETSEKTDDQNEQEKQSENEEKESLLNENNLDDIALDVIRGKYGNGSVRREALGKDYAVIQRRVNELMAANKKAGTNTPSSNKTTTSSTKPSSSTKRTGEGGGSRI